MRRFAGRAGMPAVVCLTVLLWAGCGGTPAQPTAPTPPATSLPPGGACGTLGMGSPGSTAILNGSECPPVNSAVVLLNMRDSAGAGVGACSGTVITPRAILTAAHCLTRNVAVVRVWAGAEQVDAQSFAMHPNYGGSGVGPVDVGVVLMNADLGRTPIPLLLSRDARVGEAAIVAGWGQDQSSVPATLRAGLTTITGSNPSLLETQYGVNVSSVCSGDSGGPILVSEGGGWAIAGVISATSDNVCNTGTNFYVNIRNPPVSSFVLGMAPNAGQR